MKKVYIYIFLLFSLCCLAGCATITHNAKQPVKIDSNVPGAVATVHGQSKPTPATFYLKGSSDGYDVTVDKDGYKPSVGHIDSSFRGWSTVGGNILWLLPGLIIDISTGSAYELDKQINVPMKSA